MRPIKLLSISLCLLLAAFLLISPAAAQIKIGTNGATIAPSSLLELESANQGLLLPRMADTVAINLLNPPNGMLIYLTKEPSVGLYLRKVTGWEFISGFIGGLARFNSLSVTGEVTAGTFRGPLLGNASSATTVSGNVAAVNGGTGQSLYNPGDILYAGTSTALNKLPIGLPGRVLGVNTLNMPAWLNAGSGTVTNVSGVVNRITVTDPTVAPVIDIASTYIGQNSITTLGTISTGVWNGTPITATYGGTGLNTLPLGRVLLGNGTGTVASVDGDVADLVLTSNGPGLAPTFKAPGVGDMVLSVNQTVTGIKTFGAVGNVGKLVLAGNTTGFTTLNGPGTGIGGSVVLPQTGILVTQDGTETLTNKTLTSPTLTSPSIGAAIGSQLVLNNGSALTTTNQTGTGSIVMSTSPSIATATLTGTTTTSDINATGTITATGGFSGTATNTLNVSTLTAATVVTGVNLANAAASPNNLNTIVKRDGSGNFTAGTITAALTGNASTATLLLNSRSIYGNGFNGGSDLTAAITGTYGGTGVNNGANTITLQGSLSHLGAFSQIMRATSNTDVTLPTSGLLYSNNTGSITSASLAGALSDETGSGVGALAVFSISPALTGSPTAPTQAAADNSTKIATTAYADAAAATKQNTLSNSAGLAGALNDETGTGLAVFGTAPNLIGPVASSLLADATYVATKNASVGTGVQGASAVSGTNLAGTVTIVITGGALASQALLTVNYSSNFPTGSYPVLYPATATAAALTTNKQVYATGANNGFTINSGTDGLPDGTYTWNYQVIGR